MQGRAGLSGPALLLYPYRVKRIDLPRLRAVASTLKPSVNRFRQMTPPKRIPPGEVRIPVIGVPASAVSRAVALDVRLKDESDR